MIDMDDEVANLEVSKIREKSSRKIASLLGGSALFLETIRLRVNLKAGLLEPEALRQTPACHQYGGGMCIFGSFYRNSDDVVVTKQFDRAFRAPGAFRNDNDRGPALPRASYVRHPIADAAVKLHGRLTGHVLHTALVERQLLQARGDADTRRQRVPVRERF